MRSMETQTLGDIRIDRIVEFEKPIFSPISFLERSGSDQNPGAFSSSPISASRFWWRA